jgi:hypothetical protein
MKWMPDRIFWLLVGVLIFVGVLILMAVVGPVTVWEEIVRWIDALLGLFSPLPPVSA